MAVTVTIIGSVVLTLAVIVVSRWGTREHQEDLCSHTAADDPSGDDPQPGSDRPAGPEAEPMGATTGDATPGRNR